MRGFDKKYLMLSLFLCSACQSVMLGTPTVSERTLTAQKIAQSAQMQRQDIPTIYGYKLASWRKISATDQPINLYIEGDGLAWLSKRTPSLNPTPTNPVALRLAKEDPNPNVVYLARPCQYITWEDNPSCHIESWTSERFSVDIIHTMNMAMDSIAKQYEGATFNLIGFSGGANIAGIIAAERSDVLSLRTVSGNIDNNFFTAFHKVSAMPLSLNMADNAGGSLSTMPQYHFIAENDKYVPAVIFENYAKKLTSSSCLQSEIVKGTTHSEGWAERWVSLLTKTPKCQ